MSDKGFLNRLLISVVRVTIKTMLAFTAAFVLFLLVVAMIEICLISPTLFYFSLTVLCILTYGALEYVAR